MTVPFRLLKDALRQLSLEPDEQREELAGTVVTDELVLDLDNAVRSLEHASQQAGVALDDDVVAAVQELLELLSVPPSDSLWDDDALDRHPVWAEARAVSRRLLPLLPQPR